MSKIKINVAPVGTNNFKPLLWNSVSITKSLDELCHSLTLELPVSQKHLVHVHDKIEVRFYNRNITHTGGNLRVTTVAIDEITDNTDSTNKSITILGRSPSRDIIDSAWSGKAGGADLLAVTRTIAGKFGIVVHHLPTTYNGTETVPVFEWDCESPWTKLLNAADNQGYCITSNEAGDLYITKSARDVSAWGFKIVEGLNVKSFEVIKSGAEQFHEYVVVSSGVKGSAVDNTCKTNRVLTLNLSDFKLDKEKANRRARLEMYRRRKITLKVSLDTWGLNDEQIKNLGDTYHKELFFNPNFLIPVNIPTLGLNAKMMINEVEYQADNSSFDCTLSLVNPESYMGKTK
ncbi:MAG: hypothetical protein P1P64_02695 [Treponemataceae bacterium]